MMSTHGFKRLNEGQFATEHYKSFLRQIYLHLREHPQIQASVTKRLKGMSRSIVRKLMTHALTEIGHLQLLLEDLKLLGESVEDIQSFHPLPATAALIAFFNHAATDLNLATFFGAQYFFESLSVYSGEAQLDRLRSLGIPDEAMTYIEEDSFANVSHMKLNEDYVAALVIDEASFQDFLFGMRTTAYLYGRMIEDCLAAADRGVRLHERNYSERIP